MSLPNNLPAGQHPVVELDGRPYTRPCQGASDKDHLANALTTITAAAVVGEINAMWMVAEVQSADGPKFITVRYGVGTEPDALHDRLDRLPDEFGRVRDAADREADRSITSP